jgi:site-specific recombinase XerD
MSNKMATIRFYTRTKIQKLATVHIRFTDGRQIDFRIPTPYRIFPDYWNEEKQALKQRILYSEVFTEEQAKDIEDKFNKLKDFILREHFKLSAPATKSWLQNIIDKFYYKEVPGNETLNQYIKRLIEELKSGKRLYKGTRYTPSTIKNYTGFETQFLEYQGIYSEDRLKELKEKKELPRPLKILNFEDITMDFYKKYLQYFNEKEYSPNTTGRHIKELKVIMRQARDEGLHNNMEFQNKSFEAMSEKVENIYLTETELKKIFDLDLSKNKPLEIIRDVFLCGCYTAQRYSDYSRIKKSNIRTIEGIKVIDLIQQKTGERVVIPIRQELEFILQRYDYTLPKTFEQKINEKIKVIGEKAEINDVINYEENRGGLRIKKSVKKCDLIKTHTARRSGCTNMYLAKIQAIDIMKISGHKTEREFLKYIKTGKEETAIKLGLHSYFTGNALKVV